MQQLQIIKCKYPVVAGESKAQLYWHLALGHEKVKANGAH